MSTFLHLYQQVLSEYCLVGVYLCLLFKLSLTNLGSDILELCNLLVQLRLTTSKRKLGI